MPDLKEVLMLGLDIGILLRKGIWRISHTQSD